MQRKRSTAGRQNVKPSANPRAKKSFGKDTERETRPSTKRTFSEKPTGGRRREEDSERPKRTFSKDSSKSDRPYSERSKDNSDRKPYDKTKRTFSKDEKPYGFKKEGKSDFTKSDRPYSERSKDSSDRKPFDKTKRTFSKDEKPYGFKKEGKSEFTKSDRPYSERSKDSSDRKPFDKTKRTFSKDDKPYSADRNSKFDATKKDSRPFRERVKPEVSQNEFENSTSSATNLRPRTSKPIKAKESNDNSIRLNRYISNAGICSRREADELIQQGLITVNGKSVTELGVKVMPGDIIKYEGKTLKTEKNVYVLLNKPKDFITTTDDPQERKTVMQLVANATKERIYPVGRLDRNTTGLLLFTNDGELAEKLTHPSRNVSKVYEVVLDKPITNEDLDKIRNGVRLFDGIATVDDLQVVNGNKSQIGIEIHIGRNRIVRRIFEHLGYEVIILDRVTYAGLTKKDLTRGSWRFLTEREINKLKNM